MFMSRQKDRWKTLLGQVVFYTFVSQGPGSVCAFTADKDDSTLLFFGLKTPLQTFGQTRASEQALQVLSVLQHTSWLILCNNNDKNN